MLGIEYKRNRIIEIEKQENRPVAVRQGLWRRAWRYAKKSGSRDSRIPPRYAKAVLIGLRGILGSHPQVKTSSSAFIPVPGAVLA
ncbi:hypothetical protein E3N88_42507 [Mikania micrantha]|uniref:Uncharacterized protein n=1 Tax=Mikania micrantha TaxID=192012 RepID=A0A5N6LHP1_9ASTR|nr:hypothetical protein E3N88_42507 [Mikania micrantha]